MSRDANAAVATIATLSSSLFFALVFAPTRAVAASEPVAAGYAFSLEGANTLVADVDGGEIRTVISTPSSYPTDKEVVGVTYEPAVVHFDPGAMPQPMLDWLNATWKQDHPTRTASVAEVDEEGRSVRQRHFFDATISALHLPALDARSKAPFSLGVEILPEYIVYGHPSRHVPSALPKNASWLASNFLVEIGNLPCDAVSRVEAISIRERMGKTGSIQVVSNLRLRMPATEAGAWADWYQGVIDGDGSSSGSELSGKISYLAPDLSSELGRLDLQRVGPISMRVLPPERGEQLLMMEVELYVEAMRFVIFPTDA